MHSTCQQLDGLLLGARASQGTAPDCANHRNNQHDCRPHTHARLPPTQTHLWIFQHQLACGIDAANQLHQLADQVLQQVSLQQQQLREAQHQPPCHLLRQVQGRLQRGQPLAACLHLQVDDLQGAAGQST